MAIFTGGTIPTINVSSNALLNQAVTGLAGNLADTTLSVALSPVLGAQLSSQLGLDPTASFNNLGSIVSNGVISTGQTYLNQVISNEIINSEALGPFGPLVGGLAENAVSVLGQGISGLLSGQGLTGFGGLAGILGGGGGGATTTASAPNNSPSRAFPGAGDEPYGDSEADYAGGGVYNTGNGGADVIFSIKPATTGAAATGAAEISSPAAPASMSLPESLVGAVGDFKVPGEILTAAYKGSIGNLVDTGTSTSFAAIGGSLLA